MLRPLSLSALLFLALSTPALAIDCEDAVTTIEMQECSSDSFASVDEELNAVWAEVMGSRDDAGKQSLRAAQRAWIAFRDADCAAAVEGYRGGSIASVIQRECLTARTQTRVDDLRDMLDR